MLRTIGLFLLVVFCSTSAALADPFEDFLKEQILEMESLENFYRSTSEVVLESKGFRSSGEYSKFLSQQDEFRKYTDRGRGKKDAFVPLTVYLAEFKSAELQWAILKSRLLFYQVSYKLCQEELSRKEMKDLIVDDYLTQVGDLLATTFVSEMNVRLLSVLVASRKAGMPEGLLPEDLQRMESLKNILGRFVPKDDQFVDQLTAGVIKKLQQDEWIQSYQKIFHHTFFYPVWMRVEDLNRVYRAFEKHRGPSIQYRHYQFWTRSFIRVFEDDLNKSIQIRMDQKIEKAKKAQIREPRETTRMKVDRSLFKYLARMDFQRWVSQGFANLLYNTYYEVKGIGERGTHRVSAKLAMLNQLNKVVDQLKVIVQMSKTNPEEITPGGTPAFETPEATGVEAKEEKEEEFVYDEVKQREIWKKFEEDKERAKREAEIVAAAAEAAKSSAPSTATLPKIRLEGKAASVYLATGIVPDVKVKGFQTRAAVVTLRDFHEFLRQLKTLNTLKGMGDGSRHEFALPNYGKDRDDWPYKVYKIHTADEFSKDAITVYLKGAIEKAGLLPEFVELYP
jgi:hypothetical protein